jgi:hypothetical protein
MSRPSGSVQVVLGVAVVSAAAFGVFNYSRYCDTRDMAVVQAELAATELAAADRARTDEALAAARRQEELVREVESLKATLAASRRAYDELDSNNRAMRLGLERLTTGMTGIDKQVVLLQTNLERARGELDAVRKRNGQLEEERLQLLADREKAEAARLVAEIDNKQLRDRYEGRGGKPATLVAAPEAPRGTITGLDPAGTDLMTISVGLDVGLTRGTELDVYRAGVGGKHLGTAVVAEVGQKSATARFKPAGGKTFAEVVASERPRVGDVVSKVNAERPGSR